MGSKLLQIDFPRLKSDVEALAAIGRADDQGIYRMAFSKGDMQAREWLRERITQAGLELHQDGAANLFGRLAWDPEKPAVMVGSHIDTVPGAGHLDGALGVLCGLEALRSMKEQGINLKRPLELVAFPMRRDASAVCSARRPSAVISLLSGFMPPGIFQEWV